MIKRLKEMCHNLSFNTNTAVELIKQIDVNEVFETHGELDFSHFTTLQAESVSSYNIEMLSLLLENGADPNQVYDNDESELWNLQYNDGETEKENETRLQMAQLLLEYGANPNINPDNGPEDLFQYVLFSVFDDEYDGLWEYRSRFFILLVAYGGKTDYCKPRIVKNFDKTNMKQYRLYREAHSKGIYSGVICDNQFNIIAYI